MNDYDVVIIGAGIGGLTAALALSSANGTEPSERNILVVEQHADPGGKMGRATVDGVEFDTGPSLLTMTDVLETVFQRAGTSLSAELTLRRCDPFRYRWPSTKPDHPATSLDAHFAIEDTRASIAKTLGENAAEEFIGFMRYTKEIWDAAAPNFVYGEAPTTLSALKLGATKFRDLLKIDPMRTMASAIESRVRTPELRDMFLRYATYNGSDACSAPATLNCIAWVELGLGCYGIEGGMFRLAEALASLARARGVEFQYGHRVGSVDSAQGRITGVTLRSGQRVRARAVVCNADAAHLANDLAPSLRSVDGAYPPSMSGWTALIKARRRERPPHEVLFPAGTYRDEFREIFRNERPPAEPTVYLCAQEKAHGRTGWVEHEPLFVMANAPAEPQSGASDPATWSHLREAVWKRLQNEDLIDADDRIVWQRTPAELAARFQGSRGSIYGASSNSRLSTFRRPANTVRELPGLFLASGSAHPGGGVPMCMLSGLAAAKAVGRLTQSRPASV